uniref:CobW/HypB/UreG nucleotide-binding domain-containing protein n=1 Tax=Fagus sylvatica TaxID=28930 RepID=A0A2N9J2I5_FAGSY
MGSISITADLANTLLTFTCRSRSRCHRTPLSHVRPTFLPFLLSPNNTPQSHFHSHSLRFIAKPKTGLRRFTVVAAAATTTTPPQSEGSDLSSKIPDDHRIPATIITGFLGSGKTTLLNHILTAEHGKRIAVIENEYGEVDIDGSLVAAKTTGAEDIVMLNNGCLCCTVRGDLVRMIAELVNKKKGRFDHIVIETTGLANPAPIIQTFYAEDQVFNDVKLDGVVTLVDAKHAALHLDEVKPKGIVNEAVEQIAYADRIIVNKTDLVGEPEIATLVQRIRNINRMADLKRTEFGKVDLDYVLGIGGFDLESYAPGLLEASIPFHWLYHCDLHKKVLSYGGHVSPSPFPWKCIWKVQIPYRVAFFTWVAVLVDHLLLHCPIASELWDFLFCLVGLDWVMLRTVIAMLASWRGIMGPFRGWWWMRSMVVFGVAGVPKCYYRYLSSRTCLFRGRIFVGYAAQGAGSFERMARKSGSAWVSCGLAGCSSLCDMVSLEGAEHLAL